MYCHGPVSFERQIVLLKNLLLLTLWKSFFRNGEAFSNGILFGACNFIQKTIVFSSRSEGQMRRLACNPDNCPLGLTLDRIWSCPADFKAFSIAPVSLLFYFDWNLLGSALSFLNPLSHILQTQSERESAIYRQLCIIGRKWK